MNRLVLILLLASGLALGVMVVAQTGTATTEETTTEETTEETTEDAGGSTVVVTTEGEEEAEGEEETAATDEAAQETRTIADIVREDANFSMLLEALEAAGLLETLGAEGSYTVFAPTNEAFEAFQEDGEDLSEVLQYHVAEGRMTSDFLMDLPDGVTLVTLEGSLLIVTFDNGTVMVDDATVTQTDIRAANGIIHVIDRVLTPSGLYLDEADRRDNGEATGEAAPEDEAADEVDDADGDMDGDAGDDTGGGDTGGTNGEENGEEEGEGSN